MMDMADGAVFEIPGEVKACLSFARRPACYNSSSGRLYRQMCIALVSAVREGPNSVNYRRLGCYVRNPHVRRLRSYVQQGGWGSYDQIDVADGWVNSSS